MLCVAKGKLTGGISDWVFTVNQKQILQGDIGYGSIAIVLT